MKLSEVKAQLNGLSEISFQLPDGSIVPPLFHVTEIGLITKKFIDCGGTLRNEQMINFQLYTADDFDHRLAPQKLANIIEISEKKLGLGDFEVEVEYQAQTIGKYHLSFDGTHFQLVNTQTDCLAKDKCGITPVKSKVKLSALPLLNNSCTPGSGCC